ncbi:hypothetical protein CK203_032309 [Vitis vinifera]|uniref:Reverse transcriptase domain-containing protein n=1 Tax=Vitis vinifera TaxID=29760 RepID=A0A438IJU5_VITVI|nr:hypothetical protein CK203_032309 [Vitis vinifera]
MDRDKAPGPDGFTIAVFQDCWDVIKEDLVRVFKNFIGAELSIKALMPLSLFFAQKEYDKENLRFRPISLITSLYKIIAKVLSGRLRGVYMKPSILLKALLFKGDK